MEFFRKLGTDTKILLGSLVVMTMAASAAAIAVEAAELHAAGVIAAAAVVLTWTMTSLSGLWAMTAVVAIEAVVAYGLVWVGMGRRAGMKSVSAAPSPPR